MIIGIGTDLVDAKRIEQLMNKNLESFVGKLFSEEEQLQAETRQGERRILFYATRFAAKEACAKALGTGIAEGIAFKDIRIHNDALGCPMITLHGKAFEHLEEKAGSAIPRIDLSLSDEYPMCTAFVVISAE